MKQNFFFIQFLLFSSLVFAEETDYEQQLNQIESLSHTDKRKAHQLISISQSELQGKKLHALESRLYNLKAHLSILERPKTPMNL